MILTDLEKSVDDWVQEIPETLLILEKLHLNFNQVRGQSLESVCARRGMDPRAVTVLLGVYRDNGRLLDESVLETYDIPQLIGYVLFNHHLYMEKEIPRLEKALEDAVRQDGPRHPELLELQGHLSRFLRNFLEHMKGEESQFFPFFLFMSSDPKAVALGEEGLEDLIRVIHMEDEQLLLDLDVLRQKTRWYHTPPGVGEAYRTLFSGLRLLEIDLARHMRVESRILYPKVVAFEAERLSRSVPSVP